MQILEKKACIFILNVLLYAGTCESAYAPIAQLDRVTGYEPVGRGFESLSAYQSNIIRTISSQSEAGSDYLFISHNRNKGCQNGNPCLFMSFPFRKPQLKFSLYLWLCKIGPYIIKHAASEPLNGILRNIGIIDKLLFSSHINGTLS